MEELTKCPNCLGYGCHVIYSDPDEVRICSGFSKDKPSSGCRSDYRCLCDICNGSGCVSWIDLLFSIEGERYKERFKRLRNNIKEIEELMKARITWRR